MKMITDDPKLLANMDKFEAGDEHYEILDDLVKNKKVMTSRVGKEF